MGLFEYEGTVSCSFLQHCAIPLGLPTASCPRLLQRSFRRVHALIHIHTEAPHPRIMSGECYNCKSPYDIHIDAPASKIPDILMLLGLPEEEAKEVTRLIQVSTETQ